MKTEEHKTDMNKYDIANELNFVAKLFLAIFEEFMCLRVFSIRKEKLIELLEYKYFENQNNYLILIGKKNDEIVVNKGVSINDLKENYKEFEYIIEIDRISGNLDKVFIYNVLEKLEKIVQSQIYSLEENNNFFDFFFDEAKFELKTYETQKIRKTIEFFYNNMKTDFLLLDSNLSLIYNVVDEDNLNKFNEISLNLDFENNKKIYVKDLNSLIFPILHQGETLGTLFVFLNDKEFSEFDSFNIDKLIKRLSKILIEKHESTLQKIQFDNEIFDGLVFSSGDKYILEKYNLNQINNFNCAILRIKVIGIFNHFKLIGKDLELINQRIMSILDKYNLEYFQKLEEDGICICLISKSTLLNERYNNLLNTIMNEIKLEFPNIYISAGRVYNSFTDIKNSYFEAIEGINILERYYIHRSVINYRDVGILRFVLPQDEKLILDYLDDVLQPIIEYDKSRNTELLKTLFYYCRHNKNINYVSNKLHIHQNTLYQRVKKAEELMGYDINDPMDWIDIQAASILYGLLFTDYIKNL